MAAGQKSRIRDYLKAGSAIKSPWPKPDTLKFEGKWQDPVKKFLSKKETCRGLT
jgi:hypothetical protein